MNLPSLSVPLFVLTIPSQKRKVMARNYLVPEEKILLTAQQSGQDGDILLAVKQIIQNCVQEDFDVNTLASFDLEYMFIKIRARSVSNIIEVSYKDSEDEKVYNFKIDLDEVEMLEGDPASNKIQLNDEIGVVMQYPPAALLDQIPEDITQFELGEFLIKKCLVSVYDVENVYPIADSSEAEIDKFFNSLDLVAFEKISNFFDSMPRMYYEIKYTNSLGTERVIPFTTLRDFFTW